MGCNLKNPALDHNEILFPMEALCLLIGMELSLASSSVVPVCFSQFPELT